MRLSSDIPTRNEDSKIRAARIFSGAVSFPSLRSDVVNSPSVELCNGTSAIHFDRARVVTLEVKVDRVDSWTRDSYSWSVGSSIMAFAISGTLSSGTPIFLRAASILPIAI